MIPKPEEVLDDQKIVKYRDYFERAMKEYGRRLLDHVAEKAKEKYEYGFCLDQQYILKIKDEL